ncbi:MAG: hypothetical protein AB7G37_16565, partial [Solirubrobacteraceae bacterium]
MGRRRQRVTAGLVVLACVALLAAVVTGYVRRVAVNADQFADRTAAALRDEGVRTVAAKRITDELVRGTDGDLLAVRPIVQGVVESVVGGRAFTGLVRLAVRDVHRAIFARSESTLTLTVADVGIVVAAALEQIRPELADDVRDAAPVRLLERDLGSASTVANRISDDLRLLWAVCAFLAVALTIAALWTSADRRRTVHRLGIGIAVVGGVLIVGLEVARALTVDRLSDPDARSAARGVWDAFLGDLRSAGWVLGGVGAVLAATAASLLRPVDLATPVRRVAAALAHEPRHPALGVARAVGFIAVGVVVLTHREWALSLAAAAVGLLLVYVGTTALLRLVYAPAAGADAPGPTAAPSHRRRIATATLGAAIIVAALTAFAAGGGADAPV